MAELSFSFDDLHTLFMRIDALKALPRKGWEIRRVPCPESVSDHSYGVALLCLVFAREFDLDVGDVLTTALIHDLAESIVGDVVPADGMDAKQKSASEESATALALNGFDGTGELSRLWKNFEYGLTPEGRMVKEVDRLEMAFQAERYESTTALDLGDFFPYVRDRLQDPRLVRVLDDIESRRPMNRD